MSNLINYQLLFSSTALKLIIAALQFFASILFLRYLGATEYGKILAVVALTEVVLLFSLPGIQKCGLKSLAQKSFPINAYILKSLLLLASISFLVTRIDYGFYLIVSLLICLENLNALNRASLNAQKRFNLLVSLDAIRPALSVGLLLWAINFQPHMTKEIYLISLFASVMAEIVICLPFVISGLKQAEQKSLSFQGLLKSSLLASGFSYTGTLIRKLPIIVAGTINPELSALVAIFLQFFTLLNYLISTLMIQVSIQLLSKEVVAKNTFDLMLGGAHMSAIFVGMVYLLTLLSLDFTKSIWLPLIFNYHGPIILPMTAFIIMPLVTLFGQAQFFNLFSKSEPAAEKYIFANIIATISLAAGFYVISLDWFAYFGVIIFLYQLATLLFLCGADMLYKLRES